MEWPRERFEFICTPAKLRIIEDLSIRPRSLAELSVILGMTPQGALKHVKALQKAGYIACWKAPKEGGRMVRQLYRLTKPAKVIVDFIEELLSVSIHIARKSYEIEADKARTVLAGKTLAEFYQAISEEEYELMRSLRLVREREKRIILQLFDLMLLKDRVIRDTGCNPLEEAILSAYGLPKQETEVAKIMHYLKIDRESISNTWKILGSKKAMIR